jgi:septum formation protein
MRIVLASKSPRRKEILGELVDNFEIITAPTDETLDEGVHPLRGVEILAVRKGEAVLSLVGDDAMIISSDTLVEIDGIPLGKPQDRNEAIQMLMDLSGRVHRVHTGIAVRYKGKTFSGVDTTHVRFKSLSLAQVEAYVDTGDPYDKAGGYGIQGEAGKFVEGYTGDFDTVVGLSSRLTRALMDKAVKEGEKGD